MSGIEVHIDSKEKSKVFVKGSVTHIISDTEKSSFKIGTEDQLKAAVEKYFGKRPNDVFLHSPTPWNDLYKRYGWDQVKMVLVAKKAEVLDLTSEPTILATQTLENSSSRQATFNTSITEQVTESLSTEWNNSSSVSIDQTVSYEVGLAGTNVGGSTSIGFQQTWGRSETTTNQKTVGVQAGVSVTLDPGQSVDIKLNASSGKLKIRVLYEAHLTGAVAVNYNPTYKNHHFWALPIGEVIKGNNQVQIDENIEVGFFSNISVTVSEATGKAIPFHLAEFGLHPQENKVDKEGE